MAQTLRVDVDVNVQGDQDLSGLSDGFKSAEDSVNRFDQVSTGVFERIGHKVVDFASSLASQAIQSGIQAIGDSIGLASDKAEAASKVNILYGDSAQAIIDASAGAATSVGMSSGAYLTAAGDLGNLLTNMDITGEAAAGMSTDMLTLAADVGSFNNADPTDVVAAMGAAFRGEAEPMRQFGVMLDEAGVKAQAMAMGLYDGQGALTEQARAQATYALILEGTSAAQGDFARTSEGLANQQRIAAAQQEEAWTRLGEALVPIALQVMPLISAAIQGVANMAGVLFGIIRDNAPAVAAVLGVVGAVVLATVVPPFIAWAAATLAATWPLIALAAGVALLVTILDRLGILRMLIDLFGQVAAIVSGVVGSAFQVLGGIVDALSGHFRNAFGIIGGVVDVFARAIGSAFDVVARVFEGAQRVLQGFQRIAQTVLDAVSGLFDDLASAIGDVFDGIKSTIQGAIDAVLSTFRNLWSGIQSVGGSISRFLGDLFRPLGDGINRALDVVRSAWNAFVGIWNGIQLDIPRIEIPNPLGGHIVLGGNSIGLPDLPRLAKGGIVTRPTLALLGESGPEAVTPLRHGGAGAFYQVNVQAGVGDPVAIGRAVVDAIHAFERANGPSL